MDDIKTLKVSIPEGYEIDKENSTFESIIFKKIKNQFSKGWLEFCSKHEITDKESFINNYSDIERFAINSRRDFIINKNVIPFKFAKPLLALMQLLTIREKEYIKGWEPDWEDLTTKYCISSYKNKLNINLSVSVHNALSFPTKELRDEFYENWKELIEIAKPLL